MLEVKNLYKSFGSNQVLKGIDIKVDRGEVVAVLGSSGSGKTTMLRCASFLEKADSGEMIFDGDEERSISFGCTWDSYSSLSTCLRTEPRLGML